MQATIIFACLAFLALSHQAISTEGQAVTEVAQQVQEARNFPGKCRGRCRPGKLAALALDLDQTEATLPVGDGAETVGTEPIKTPPAMENNGQTRQTTLSFEHKEEASETKPTAKETSNLEPTLPEQLYQISVLDIMADFFM
ncbi:hypothetical protein MJO29_009670 [Puccinia striiformis f. sp. tritici]|uniref:Uncharacterized protein n=1 Tax=Puccinia striiformis f. sp. tritici PST-78 TaxID=1165861 RepID=A0A0L0VN66_9BASI|nr:hypothetical protein Pst134EA_017265 [Puccinia striiformis f. sp. tritici]KAH9460957.1 hypothetical protein Pst134EA_017265 [Puccinia striiformis f. sp. tritici]KAI7950996.1 hypothetical protein MJO29_009670 [Puccinia striiformis f. sp. tritici]KAI9622492.1 hypothetical protein H4Q26_015173 [Puccinia striiformis f. sp. tritici PST-130]KNF00728.1 hypothetical protein PSTG_06142 [Puccinia striiformis f. sp. tritici PST-78]